MNNVKIPDSYRECDCKRDVHIAPSTPRCYLCEEERADAALKQERRRRERLREQYMGMAMQGILAGFGGPMTPDEVAMCAERNADALLARLDGEVSDD